MSTDNEVALREYFDKMLEAHLREHIHMDKAQLIFAEVMDARLNHVNALREQLTKVEATLLTRNEYRIQHDALSEAHGSLKNLVYVGLGLMLALEFLVPIGLQLLKLK